jgi:hypothetical protein
MYVGRVVSGAGPPRATSIPMLRNHQHGCVVKQGGLASNRGRLSSCVEISSASATTDHVAALEGGVPSACGATSKVGCALPDSCRGEVVSSSDLLPPKIWGGVEDEAGEHDNT